MTSSAEDYYDRMTIDGKPVYVCLQCDECQPLERDIVSHIVRQHVRPQQHRHHNNNTPTPPEPQTHHHQQTQQHHNHHHQQSQPPQQQLYHRPPRPSIITTASAIAAAAAAAAEANASSATTSRDVSHMSAAAVGTASAAIDANCTPRERQFSTAGGTGGQPVRSMKRPLTQQTDQMDDQVIRQQKREHMNNLLLRLAKRQVYGQSTATAATTESGANRSQDPVSDHFAMQSNSRPVNNQTAMSWTPSDAHQQQRQQHHNQQQLLMSQKPVPMSDHSMRPPYKKFRREHPMEVQSLQEYHHHQQQQQYHQQQQQHHYHRQQQQQQQSMDQMSGYQSYGRPLDYSFGQSATSTVAQPGVGGHHNTGEQKRDTKRFQCTEHGCGKTFGFMQSMLLHRRKHSQRVDKTAANLTTKPLNLIAHKPQIAANQWTHSTQVVAGGYLRVANKWFKVRRLTDRSINRDEKVSHLNDMNYKGLQSLKRLREWYRSDVVDGQKYYYCLYRLSSTLCTFSTHRSQHMARHLNCSHFRTREFRCREPDCGRVYVNPTTLRQHELNHQCGFGIENGKTMAGPCGNPNINKFRRRVIESGVKLNQCAICELIFRTGCAIKRHIHDQHLCPVRNEWVECSPPPPDQPLPVDAVLLPMDMSGGGAGNGGHNPVVDSSGGSIEIVGEIVAAEDLRAEVAAAVGASQREVTRQIRQRVLDSCPIGRFALCMEETKRLALIRAMFDRRLMAGQCRYVCRECDFPATSVSDISAHLQLKHYVL